MKQRANNLSFSFNIIFLSGISIFFKARPVCSLCSVLYFVFNLTKQRPPSWLCIYCSGETRYCASTVDRWRSHDMQPISAAFELLQSHSTEKKAFCSNLFVVSLLYYTIMYHNKSTTPLPFPSSIPPSPRVTRIMKANTRISGGCRQ